MSKERVKGLVSVVISNYNNEEYIVKCLDSVLNQTYKNIEIIIIDDASTDNSVNIINSWILDKGHMLYKQNRIVFEKLSVNIGFSGAVTIGLFLASGEFIAMHDGDDYSIDTRIEKQVQYLRENKNIKVVGSNYGVFTNDNEILDELNFIKFGAENIKVEFANGNNPVSYGTMMFDGKLFDKVGGLTRKINGAEDYEYMTKLLPYGIDNIDEVLYMYRNHEKQRSREFYSNGKNNNITRENLSVMLLLDKFNIGGTETHVLYLAKELIRQGVKVSIVSGIGEMMSEFKKLDCHIYNIEFPAAIITNNNTLNIFKDKIKKIIEIENTNVIHAHQSSSGSIAVEVAQEKDIEVVFTIHGMYYYDIIPNILNKCKKIISVSYPVYDWLLDFSIPSRVIANGINFDEFNNEANSKNTIKDLYSIPKDAKVAMYCSRMAWGKIKTCENLIRVCRDLARREKLNIHALVVGDGPGYEELKGLGDKVNKQIGEEIIHFTGGITSVKDFYNTSDFIIGTGRVAIEAMAAKKPLIATGNNGYVGIVKKDNFEESWRKYFGDHGSIKDNNAIYLYEDIKKILETEAEHIEQANNIFDRSKETFDIVKITNEIIEVYLQTRD